ncbi:hypothetical protein [uncultured Deinococcus sp.]|nr:hypothetical protein [uncultured Deinococcus sp.]
MKKNSGEPQANPSMARMNNIWNWSGGRTGRSVHSLSWNGGSSR